MPPHWLSAGTLRHLVKGFPPNPHHPAPTHLPPISCSHPHSFHSLYSFPPALLTLSWRLPSPTISFLCLLSSSACILPYFLLTPPSCGLNPTRRPKLPYSAGFHRASGCLVTMMLFATCSGCTNFSFVADIHIYWSPSLQMITFVDV